MHISDSLKNIFFLYKNIVRYLKISETFYSETMKLLMENGIIFELKRVYFLIDLEPLLTKINIM